MIPWSRSERAGNDPRILALVVDENADERETLGRFLAAWNFEPVAAITAAEAVGEAERRGLGIALIADHASGTASIELVRKLRKTNAGVETILITAEDSAEFATEAFRAGAYDCLRRPVDYRQLSQDLNTLREAVWRRKEREIWETEWPDARRPEEMVGSSPPMQAVYSIIRRLALEDSPVLFTGLIGTGKEVAASALHARSSRPEKPLVVYRCFGTSDGLAEDELFGVSAGIEPGNGGCPGQKEQVAGVLESAQGGTLLLDEIGDLPLRIQEKLFNAIHSGQVQLAGGGPVAASIRLLAATRLDLVEQVGRGLFHEGLFRLLSENVIHLPSLAERPEDIPALCRHFLRRCNEEYGKPVRRFSSTAARVLLAYPWPGNVRELENVIGRACLLADELRIEVQDLSVAGSLDSTSWSERLPAQAGWETRALAGTVPSRRGARKSARAGAKK